MLPIGIFTCLVVILQSLPVDLEGFFFVNNDTSYDRNDFPSSTLTKTNIIDSEGAKKVAKEPNRITRQSKEAVWIRNKTRTITVYDDIIRQVNVVR